MQSTDLLVGRVCTLLLQLSKKFCVLPPRFCEDLTPELQKEVVTAMTVMFGQYKSHGGSFAAVLHHCFVSLCFHMVRPYSTYSTLLLHLVTPPLNHTYSTQDWLQNLPA